MKLVVLLSVSVLLLFGCQEKEELSFGTFNIAWLGDGINDKIKRDSKDYNNLKELIESLEVDVLALQEIENHTALTKIIDTNNYKILTSSYPKSQKTALIIKKEINVLDIYELDNISLGNRDLRPGLVAYCEYRGTDFFVGSFHFKSTSRYDDTPFKRSRSFDIRQEQSDILIKELKKLVQLKSDDDVILLGDFNDNPTKKSSNIIALENEDFDFLTSNMKSCKYPMLKSIDHIILSKSLSTNVIHSSLFMLDINAMYNENEVRNISDHCPVIVRLSFD